MAKRTNTGATVSRAGNKLVRTEGENYNGQTPANIRAAAKIAASGNKSKPYKFKPADTPSASGTKAYNNATPASLRKAQRKIRKGK